MTDLAGMVYVHINFIVELIKEPHKKPISNAGDIRYANVYMLEINLTTKTS